MYELPNVTTGSRLALLRDFVRGKGDVVTAQTPGQVVDDVAREEPGLARAAALQDLRDVLALKALRPAAEPIQHRGQGLRCRYTPLFFMISTDRRVDPGA